MIRGLMRIRVDRMLIAVDRLISAPTSTAQETPARQPGRSWSTFSLDAGRDFRHSRWTLCCQSLPNSLGTR